MFFGFVLFIFSSQNHINVLEERSDAIPVGVTIKQMEKTGTDTCETKVPCTNDLNTPGCGEMCYPDNNKKVFYEYRFKGVQFQVYGTYDPNHRTFDVYLDNQKVTTINQQRTPRSDYQLQYTSEVFPYDDHIIRIQCTGLAFEFNKITFWPSLYAIRINSTEFCPSSWTQESDQIGGVRHYIDNGKTNTASKNLQLTKFWVYGTECRWHHQMKVTFGAFNDQINEDVDYGPPPNRRDNKLVYESPLLPLSTNDLVFTPQGTVTLSCVFYIDEPETIPISIPMRQITKVSGSNYCQTSSGDACEDNIIKPSCGERCWSTGDHTVTYEYSFIGEKFQVFGTYDPNHGNYSIYLDDKFLCLVNQKRNRLAFQLQYTSDRLPYGNHKIKIAGIGQTFELNKITYWPSMKAKRINSTEFTKDAVWTPESDGAGGVREYTNTNGNKATKSIRGSKFWVYGTKCNWHKKAEFQFGSYKKEFDEHEGLQEPNRKDSVLVFDSPVFPYATNTLILKPLGTFTLNCVFYIDEPMVTDQLYYVDKVFKNTLPYSQIVFYDFSTSKQISGCNFTDIDLDFDYFIQAFTEIQFFDNIFNYSDLIKVFTAPIRAEYSGNFNMVNCKFINSKTRNENGANVFISKSQINLNIESCQFLNCGNSENQFIIIQEDSRSSIQMVNSIFSFDDLNQSCSVLNTASSDVIIDGCTFIKCGNNTININSLSENGDFQFINNIVENAKERVINANNMTVSPVINHNIFRNCQLVGYLIVYNHNQNEIYLLNNTFSQITNNIDTQIYGGAISCWYFNQQSSIRSSGYSFTYDKCKFYENTNANTNSPFNQGGAFSYSIEQINGDVSFFVIDCEFKGNRCEGGKGGAISLNINHEIRISNCTFENNQASNNGGAIFISNQLPATAANSFLLIEKCIFQGNKASNGHGINIENSAQTVVEIHNCKFQDNCYNNNNYVILSGSTKQFLFNNSIITFSNPSQSCGYIKLSNPGFHTISNSYINSTKLENAFYYVIGNSNVDYLLTIENNTFNNMQNTNRRCFYISMSHPLIFQNNTIQNLPSGSYMGVIASNGDHNYFNIISCKFININSNVVNCGGYGLWINRKPGNIGELLNILYKDCHWINNYVNSNGGAVESGDTNTMKQNCITFEDCTFMHNRAGRQGGAISSKCTQPITLINCTFKNNTSMNGNSSALNLYNNQAILISDCKFIENIASSHSGAIFIDSVAGNNAHITNCFFGKNKGTKYNALHVKGETEYFVTDSIFEDNYIEQSSNSAIYVESSSKFNFINSTVNFTSTSTACAAIKFLKNYYGNHIISNSSFIKTNAEGGIYYWSDNKIDNPFDYTLKIENCLFDSFEGPNKAVFYIQIPHLLVFHNNTIQNRNGNYIGWLTVPTDSQVSYVTFSMCNFINLSHTNKNCGGCGLWMNNIGFTHFIITFDGCLFENNFASNSNGGAIDYGSGTNSLDSNEIIFLGCKFIKNKSNKNGGAISILTKYPVKIHNCSFYDNNAINGGAIYIDPKSKTMTGNCSIVNCSFENNFGATNGHAIYLMQYTQTYNYFISGATFMNNFRADSPETEGIIVSEESQLFLNDVNFIFKGSSKILRTIVYLRRSLTISNIVFEKVRSDNDKLFIFDTTFYDSVSFINCMFINCHAAKSFSITSSVNSFSFIDSTIINSNEDIEDDMTCIGGLFASNQNSCTLTNSNFIDFGPLNSIQTEVLGSLNIEHCTFCCSSFDISVKNPDFIFNNNIMKNNTYTNHYFGTINCNNLIAILEINNMQFIDNICNNLYGGGSGLYLYGFTSISFIGCTFKRNKAEQDKSISRPNQYPTIPYYNGDGGAIQIGYKCETNNIDVSFNNCKFIKNEAYRHGGAIAIHTLQRVDIIDCIFEGNIANHLSDDSSQLLFNNHFHRKNNGRGGAIYINPTYNTESLQCSSYQNKHMTNVKIYNCTFESNIAHDGYAIYIEGEEAEIDFIIIKNDFINNFLKETLKRNSSIIATEICNFSFLDVIENNDFINQENGEDIYVSKISCVDHRGKPIPSKVFTNSVAFSESTYFSYSSFFTISNKFTKSQDFSKSNYFSESEKFSKTNDFSQSIKFTLSNNFTQSEQFSNSIKFTKSKYFSESSLFSETSGFSKSVKFTKSNFFSKSDYFSKSNDFSQSKMFTNSDDFTVSNLFSESSLFSKSKMFSDSKHFSKSSDFSQSKGFSYSEYFSRSKDFSKSSLFTLSTEFTISDLFSMSEKFTLSKIFSNSVEFSNSNAFSESVQFSLSDDFTQSTKFTSSKDFSFSEMFSKSVVFSNSIEFSKSIYFSKSEDFTKTTEFTTSSLFSRSDGFTLSKMFSKSSDFSYSSQFSKSIYFTRSEDFSQSIEFTKSNLFSMSNEFSFSEMFSKSVEFSNSIAFTGSTYFSESEKFTLSSEFTKSNLFSKSNEFSFSQMFSKSEKFSNSIVFTESTYFSESEEFTLSSKFTKSDLFSKSNEFSFSEMFSKSVEFSNSIKFSKSMYFSKSEDFTQTTEFTTSSLFSKSDDFTLSTMFSESVDFTYSNSFSKSDYFTKTDDFTETIKFSQSTEFTISNYFTVSNYFSQSQMFSTSADFSNSIAFTKSTYFSGSEKFTLSSEFAKSNLFSMSNEFSFSEIFTKSVDFSHSIAFTKSKYFSESEKFTETIKFTISNLFSKSGEFSRSKIFSKSLYFSNSNQFTNSIYFTKSEDFTQTTKFTLSNLFSKSDAFSRSKMFSKSSWFSQSLGFSQSIKFTKSNEFSETNSFTHSNDFTKSMIFTKSKDFTLSNKFTKSVEFSSTDLFSFTNEFTQSNLLTMSNYFSNSKDFSSSNFFTKSNYFSNSDQFSKTAGFTETVQFSQSKDFSMTNLFTESNFFSNSIQFTSTNKFSSTTQFSLSSKFSLTKQFTYTNYFTKSDYLTASSIFSPSLFTLKTNEFSVSNIFSNSKQFSYSSHFSNSEHQETDFKPTKSQTFSATSHFDVKDVQNNLSKTKKKSTLIIGIVVGIVVFIAIVLTVILVLVLRKNKNANNNEQISDAQSIDVQMSVVSTLPNFSNPLYNEDINDSRDPFDERFNEDMD